MFARSASRCIARKCAQRPREVARPLVHQHQLRKMGGGGHYMEVSEQHTLWGEVFGVACWLWIFHRARHDLPVVLGMRHAWEHGGDDHDHGHGHADASVESRHEHWDKFSSKAMQQLELDDDDDDEEEEENDDEEE